MNILLVEDDDVAAEAVVRSIAKNSIKFPITVAENGKVALDIMRGNHPSKALGYPYVVLLDLNMPKMNGFEFLKTVRGDVDLNKTVVFVLSTSGADSDRLRAYNDNIAGYMMKEKVGPQFSKLFALLEAYAETVTFAGHAAVN